VSAELFPYGQQSTYQATGKRVPPNALLKPDLKRRAYKKKPKLRPKALVTFHRGHDRLREGAVAGKPRCEGEPVNETFVIEDMKLKAIGSPAEVLSRCPAPEASMPRLRKLIRRRMSFHYGQKAVQAVRLVNVNNETFITGLGSRNRFDGKKFAGDNLARLSRRPRVHRGLRTTGNAATHARLNKTGCANSL
jgi:hypothetical protein